MNDFILIADNARSTFESTPLEQANLHVQWVLAYLTLAAIAVAIVAVVVAILSAPHRFNILSPKFRITCNIADAEINSDRTTTWIHLTVAYTPRWLRLPYVLHAPATNCRVMLRNVYGPVFKSGNWSTEPVIPPLQLCWPFEGRSGAKGQESDDRPSCVNIAVNEAFHVDFMELQSELNAVVPIFYRRDEKFGRKTREFGVLPKKHGDYEVYLVCDHLTTASRTFRVEWDGEFPRDRDDVKNHISVTDITPKGCQLRKRFAG